MTTTPAMPDLLREIVAYCREAGHDWSSLAEAEHMLATLQAQPTPTEHIKEPYTLAELNALVASNEYNAELLLQHAMLLLNAQPAEVSDADIYGALEPTIVSRYVVEKRVGGGFWGYCVKAGDGEQEIFVGHKNACEHVRQALQTACLDGAYMAHEKARAILALRPQAVPMTPRMIELLAAMEPVDQHEDNGSGLVICPACDAYMNMQWKAGQRIDKIEDLAHDEECPAVWARAQLAHGITAPAGGEKQA